MIPNSVTSIRNAEDRVGNLDKSLLPSEEEKGCRTPLRASDYSLPLKITPTGLKGPAAAALPGLSQSPFCLFHSKSPCFSPDGQRI